jgi:hypothetical protein
MNLRSYRSVQAADAAQRADMKRMSPAERLELVEQLRLEAGKCFYDYPARLRRVFVPAGKAPR